MVAAVAATAARQDRQAVHLFTVVQAAVGLTVPLLAGLHFMAAMVALALLVERVSQALNRAEAVVAVQLAVLVPLVALSSIAGNR